MGVMKELHKARKLIAILKKEKKALNRKFKSSERIALIEFILLAISVLFIITNYL